MTTSFNGFPRYKRTPGGGRGVGGRACQARKAPRKWARDVPAPSASAASSTAVPVATPTRTPSYWLLFIFLRAPLCKADWWPGTRHPPVSACRVLGSQADAALALWDYFVVVDDETGSVSLSVSVSSPHPLPRLALTSWSSGLHYLNTRLMEA